VRRHPGSVAVDDPRSRVDAARWVGVDPDTLRAGPVFLPEADAVQRTSTTLKAAVKDAEPADTFMTAASPGVFAASLWHARYPTDEEYIFALADAM
jgi:hypothetical protein